MITLTAAADFSGAAFGLPPRVRLDVTTTTGSPNSVAANSLLTLWRIHQDGSEHRVLTPPDPRSISGSWVGYDYHSPYNREVSYRVQVGSASATASGVWVPSSVAWLIHPSDITRSVCLDSVRSIGTRSTKSRAGRFTPPGEKPIFISEGRRDGISGAIVVKHSDADAILALTDDDPLLLINTPGDGWRVGWMWVQPGQMDYDNPGGAYWPWDTVTIPWEEAQEPDADLISAWTAGIAAKTFKAAGINAGQMKLLYANAAALKTNTTV